MSDSKETCETSLIERVQAGDETAFRQLVLRYSESLFTFLYRLCGDRHKAEDLFQETFLRAWRNIRRFETRKNFRAWLFAIANNVSIDAMRYDATRSMIKLRAEPPETIMESTPDSEFYANELRHTLDKLVARLPEKQRRVFLLRQHSGMSFREISKVLHEPINTVISHMHYAVQKLRKALKEENAH